MSRWYIVAVNGWYIIAVNKWYIFAVNYWYIIGCKVTGAPLWAASQSGAGITTTSTRLVRVVRQTAGGSEIEAAGVVGDLHGGRPQPMSPLRSGADAPFSSIWANSGMAFHRTLFFRSQNQPGGGFMTTTSLFARSREGGSGSGSHKRAKNVPLWLVKLRP